MSNMIEVKQVTKYFKNVAALQDVSLTIGENKIYGLLGRNGAGKSTLLNLITNRLFADAGSITIDGMPNQERDAALSQVYMMSECTMYPEQMRVREALRISAMFYPAFDQGYASQLAAAFGLDTSKRVRALSTGYASIFKIVIALACGAPYLLLDEPVLGLDANHRELFYRMLLERYSTHPCTIVISTHLIEEVASVIEQVVIIKGGRIIIDEPVESLLQKGYTVSGSAAAVDDYIRGRDVLGQDSLGGLKTAYLMGKPQDVLPQGLALTPLDLQRLFIQLTNV
nr:ABC transporter ATP-binding protein [Maliibacterium massiliense]